MKLNLFILFLIGLIVYFNMFWQAIIMVTIWFLFIDLMTFKVPS